VPPGLGMSIVPRLSTSEPVWVRTGIIGIQLSGTGYSSV
jgi:hypothetical protein